MSVPVLDGYSGLVEINRGGSSTIYSAFDDRHNRKVAIKVLTFRSLDATTSESLRRELRAMGLLGDHPHIVSVHDSGIAEDGSPFLVMPLFTEGSYTSRVSSEGPLGWVEVADIGVKLCSALEVAHRSSVLHRDIKPGNVFAGEYRTYPMLGDFGISTLEGGGNTTTGAVAYTLKYAAPEVVEGEKQTKSSDIYSLGATFRYLLGGVPPYSAASTTALLEAIVAGSPQPLPMGVPAGLVELLDSMIARDPADRPESCLEVANRLREIQEANGESQTPLITKPAVKNPEEESSRQEQPLASLAFDQSDISTEADPLATGEVADITGRHARGNNNSNKGRRWLIGGVSAAVVALLAVVLINAAKTDTSETASPSAPKVSVVAEPIPADEDTASIETEEPASDKGTNNELTIFEGHEAGILWITGLVDGRVASTSEDASIRIWDPENPDVEPEVFEARLAWRMQGLADGRIILGTIESGIQVWDPTKPAESAVVFEGHAGRVEWVTIMSGNRIASGGEDGTVRVWNLTAPTAAPIVFKGHSSPVVSVVELPGNRIASASLDQTVKVWDLNQPGAVHTRWEGSAQVGTVSSMVATDDGRIAIGDLAGDIHIRDPNDLDAKPVILRGHVGRITALDITKDGRIISGSIDGIVRVWDLNNEVPDPIVLEGATDEIRSVTRFGDNQIAAGTADGLVLTWDLGEK